VTYPGEGHRLQSGQQLTMEESGVHMTSLIKKSPVTPNTMSHGDATLTIISLLNDYRHWDDHMPLPYGYQPSSPFRSSLHVPPRGPPRNEFEGQQQNSSSSVHFRDFSDAVHREIQRVSLTVSLFLSRSLQPGKIIFGAEIICVTLIRCYRVISAVIFRYKLL
jgi:hypothetical protein